MFELSKVTKIYSPNTAAATKALDSIDLQLSAGDFIAVQGPSGSGKSTLMNIIGLIDQPTEGHYFIDGEDVSKWSDKKLSKLRNEKIGFIIQDFALINNETALYNIGLPMYISGRPMREIKLRTHELLQMMDIEDQMNKKVSQMSGGQRQRVAICRALINSPDIILADEPTGALDQENSHLVVETLSDLNREKGVTILMVTHDNHIASYAKEVRHIIDGRWS